MESVQKIISEIIESIRQRELIVFCGAGISYNSGLPIVNQLVPYILNKLNIPKDEQKILMGPDLDNMHIPFEAFVEVIQENSNAEPIYEIYELGAPNTNHFLLAKLMKAGFINTIVTTNFDRLIEEAMEISEDGQEKKIESKDYDVFYKENQFSRIDWNSNRQKLIKTHGSIDDRENMAITIKQVASRELSGQRKSVVERIFSTGNHKSVLIMGYSCSDAFDIGPQIQAIKDKCKKVFYLQHINKDRKPFFVELTTNNNLPDKIDAVFKGFEAIKLYFNTDIFTERLWKELTKDEYGLIERKTNWQSNIDIWADNIADYGKHGIAGMIFHLISEFRISIKYLEQARNIFREIGDKRGEGGALNHLGDVCYNLGQYHKAIEYHEQTLKISREIGNKQGEGIALGNLGSAYCNLSDYHKAKEYYEQALEILKPMLGNNHPYTKLFKENLRKAEMLSKQK